MAVTNFPAGVSSFGIPLAGGLVPTGKGTYLFVDGERGSDGNTGKSLAKAYATIQKAVDNATEGSVILVAPKTDGYDETVTYARADAAMVTIVGIGPRGSVFIDPSTEDAAGMVVHQDDITLINIGVAAEDDTSAAALTVTGSRFRAYGCKIEGGADQIIIGPGTVAQEAAGTHGVGADFLFDDCEICWGTDGVVLTCTDYGAVTQGVFRKSRFHNLTANGITEAVGSGGSAATTYRNIVVDECVFDDLEDGTAPTNAYIDLNANNGNTGVVSRCVFPVASNGGKVLLSTALVCVGCFFTGGISTGQPT
jgi:hypothetical protein